MRCVGVCVGGVSKGSLGVRTPTFQGLVVVSPGGKQGREKEKDFCAIGGLWTSP